VATISFHRSSAPGAFAPPTPAFATTIEIGPPSRAIAAKAE
jgi:hypothetical protein